MNMVDTHQEYHWAKDTFLWNTHRAPQQGRAHTLLRSHDDYEHGINLDTNLK